MRDDRRHRRVWQKMAIAGVLVGMSLTVAACSGGAVKSKRAAGNVLGMDFEVFPTAAEEKCIAKHLPSKDPKTADAQVAAGVVADDACLTDATRIKIDGALVNQDGTASPAVTECVGRKLYKQLTVRDAIVIVNKTLNYEELTPLVEAAKHSCTA